jgi:hypothetical protein
MKKFFALFLVVVGVSYGQLINQTSDGLNHKVFQVYTKSTYTSSTANETTAYMKTFDANRIAVKYTVNDTIKAILRYQFKDSFTGSTGPWLVVVDSVSGIGTSSALRADRVHAFVPSDTTTSGYDLVRFYIDYVTYLGVAYTGGTLKIYTDIYKP